MRSNLFPVLLGLRLFSQVSSARSSSVNELEKIEHEDPVSTRQGRRIMDALASKWVLK